MLSPPPPWYTTSVIMFYTCLVTEVVYHNGEQHRIRKIWKFLCNPNLDNNWYMSFIFTFSVLIVMLDNCLFFMSAMRKNINNNIKISLLPWKHHIRDIIVSCLLVDCGLTTHYAMFQLYSDETVVQIPSDLLSVTRCNGQLGLFSDPCLQEMGAWTPKASFNFLAIRGNTLG